MKQFIIGFVVLLVIILIHDFWIGYNTSKDSDVCYAYYMQYGDDFTQCEVERVQNNSGMWLLKHF